MTLADLIAWHRGQVNYYINLADDAYHSAQDNRASANTRSLYLQDQGACLDFVRHHRNAVQLLESLK